MRREMVVPRMQPLHCYKPYRYSVLLKLSQQWEHLRLGQPLRLGRWQLVR